MTKRPRVQALRQRTANVAARDLRCMRNMRVLRMQQRVRALLHATQPRAARAQRAHKKRRNASFAAPHKTFRVRGSCHHLLALSHRRNMQPVNLGVDDRILTLPESPTSALSIRAKAMLFCDPQSRDLIEQVERVAASDATVLVIGETGTGKELIARHVHRHSGRKGPFVAVNCGAFSETLIDAELFGHESGAYTGATGARAGWFEAANGGTLFLDEIGDLPLPLQVKLLRVLQERQVVRLGSRKPIALDVRLVAATNIDLQRAVDAQHFRADLYWRLSVATLRLPPLRERPGDVLPLAQHFIGTYAPRLQLERVRLSAAAEAALLAYAWPGNIRELENVIHYALIVCRDGLIEPSDLKLVSSHRLPPALAPAPRASIAEAAPVAGPLPAESAAPPAPAAPQDLLAQLLDELLRRGTPTLLQWIEETLVRRAYAHCRDNQVQTARALGITRNTMRTLLKRYGLIADGAEALQTPDAGELGEGNEGLLVQSAAG